MDIIDKFLNFEEKYKLIEKEINGFCIWGYIRFNIYKILAGQQSIIVEPVKRRRFGC